MDALLLAAPPSTPTQSLTHIDIAWEGLPVTNLDVTVDIPVPFAFDLPGSYLIVASRPQATPPLSSEFEVQAVSASFGPNPAGMIGKSRSWPCADVPFGTPVERDAGYSLSATARPGGGTDFSLAVRDEGPRYLVARLGSAAGPVLDSAAITGFSIERMGGAVETEVVYADGSRLFSDTIRLSIIPDGLEVRAHIFVGGVTFLDGTLDFVITAADLDATGSYTFHLLAGPNVTTSVCHTFAIYQNGVLLGSP